MTVLYPNPLYNELCNKATALYKHFLKILMCVSGTISHSGRFV